MDSKLHRSQASSKGSKSISSLAQVIIDPKTAEGNPGVTRE